jgi:hypothetical protein
VNDYRIKASSLPKKVYGRIGIAFTPKSDNVESRIALSDAVTAGLHRSIKRRWSRHCS